MKFVTGKELEKEIHEVIWNAEKDLILVSPYIKLDKYFIDILSKKLRYNPFVHVQIVFGKNEKNILKSINKYDLEYFKELPNISIIYLANLHAKYYANEFSCIMTSLNLYDKSFESNVEFGLMGNLDSDETKEINNYVQSMIQENKVLFIKRPILKNGNYLGSEILYDEGEKVQRKSVIHKRISEFSTFIDYDKLNIIKKSKEEFLMEERQKFKEKNKGFCIRCKNDIPLNAKAPLCVQCYKSWVYYSDVNFPEAYCHKCGIPSKGKTSMKNPLLKECCKESLII